MTPNTPPREVTVEHPDKVVWLVTAVPRKGERFTHGYAFFSEASALHYIEREKVEDDERAAFGRQRIHVPDSWQVVRYIPESSARPAAEWVKAHALPSWLTGLFWIQFDDGTVGRRPATRDNGAWWYGSDKEHAPVIAYCPALPPPPPEGT